MKPAEELTYTEAVAELESIVAKLRGDNCDVDALTAMTRRAAEHALPPPTPNCAPYSTALRVRNEKNALDSGGSCGSGSLHT